MRTVNFISTGRGLEPIRHSHIYGTAHFGHNIAHDCIYHISGWQTIEDEIIAHACYAWVNDDYDRVITPDDNLIGSAKRHGADLSELYPVWLLIGLGLAMAEYPNPEKTRAAHRLIVEYFNREKIRSLEAGLHVRVTIDQEQFRVYEGRNRTSLAVA